MNFNTKKVGIFAYHPASESAKLLSEYTGIKRIKHKNSRFNRRGKYVINWGCSEYNKFPFFEMHSNMIINHPTRVRTASNKLSFFSVLREQGSEGEGYLPAWTTDRGLATEWIQQRGTVVCRTVLNGHKGRGIVLASTPEELVDAPLFTKYIKKKREFRIHVMDGKVIDAQEKKKRIGHEGGGHKVRNTNNGYVFCRTGVVVPQVCQDVAVKCVGDLGLDFGGVDVIYNEHYDRAYVLEVNTAPGIEGTTIKSYADALDTLLTRLG